MLKFYTVKAEVMLHRGKAYRKGDTIALADEIAAAQLKAGNVSDSTSPSPQSPKKEDK